MKKKIYLLLVVLISLGAMAQDDALTSQYLFNPLQINPAYAGSRERMSASLL